MANNCTPQIQAKINDLYQLKPYQAQTGILDLALSPINSAQLEAKMIKKNGKNSTYSITYPADLCTAVLDCGDEACDAAVSTVSDTTVCDVLTSFDCAKTKRFNIAVSTFRDLGMLQVSDVIGHQVFQQMQKLKEKVNLAVLLSVNSAVGVVPGADPNRVLKLMDANTRMPVFGTDVEIQSDFADNGWDVMPIVIGNRAVKQWQNAINKGSYNQHGLNVGAIESFNAFYDKNINATNTAPTNVGNDVMFAVLPQLINVLSYSENVDMFASANSSIDWANLDPMRLVNTDNSTFLHTVLQDPQTGMLFDFDITYDPTCKTFTWKLSVYYKTKILDLIGCNDATFNGLVKYDICAYSNPSCL